LSKVEAQNANVEWEATGITVLGMQ
jgi:hypothetical protein